MSLPRMSLLQGRFGAFFDPDQPQFARARRNAAHDMAARWQAALRKDPRLQQDLCRLGGVYAAPPVHVAAGTPHPGDKTLYQCGVDEGRRALALELLALLGLTGEEMDQLLEDHDDH